jgi:hypothetical protein
MRLPPIMSTPSLKQRVDQLESQVAALQSALENNGKSRRKDWRRAVEKYAGDDDLLAALAEGRKLREAERKQARRTRRPRP